MKKSEIRVGGLYLAKVSGQVTTVRVDTIRETATYSGNRPSAGDSRTVYDVTNLRTGRKTTFRSAAKFRGIATTQHRGMEREAIKETMFNMSPTPWHCEPKGNDPLQESTDEALETAPTMEAEHQESTDEIHVGSRVVFVGPNYDNGLGISGVQIGRRGVVTERGGHTAQSYGGPVVELITVEFDGGEKPVVLDINRVRIDEESTDEAFDAMVARHDEQEGEQRSDPTPAISSVEGAAATTVTGTAVVLGCTTGSSLAAKIVASRVERQVGTPVAGMVPNDEQESILAIAYELNQSNQRGRVLVINAGAGTGKTSTDRMLEQVLVGTGQYTAFNKALVEESRTKFKKASVHTTYALAFRAMGKDYAHRLGADRVKSWRVAQMLGMSDLTIIVRGKGQPLMRGSDEWNEYMTRMGYRDYVPPMGGDGEALWRNQDDEETRSLYADWLEEQGRVDHAEFVRNPCGDLVRTLKADFLAGQVREVIRRFCQSADPIEYISNHIWSGVINPLGDEAKRQFREYLIPHVRKYWDDMCDPQGQLPFDHICYVKMWQLGTGDKRPVIGADYILLDEAQDTPPVFLDILKQQQHALLVLVGDDNQQIYEFLGAVNAMSSFKGAPRRLLSQSYRFGQAIADVANSVLGELEQPTDLVMRGNPGMKSRVAEVPNPRCYLYRTNAGAVARVMVAFEEGKKPHLIGGGEDTVKWCEAALHLQHGRKTSHPDLCCFDTWGEVVEYSKTDEGADLRLMVKIVTKFGAENIMRALRNMPKEENADLVVSTAHKSKGREWDTVKLGEDFPLINRMSDGEVRLLYVAATRAKHTLDISGCPSFCGGREFENDPNSKWIPGLRVTYTAPMPTEVEQVEWLAVPIAPKTAPPAIRAALPATDGGIASPRPDATAIAVGVGNGKFTWAKQDGAWMARGPGGYRAGDQITVERRDGSKQTMTVKRVVRQYGDAWIYEV